MIPDDIMRAAMDCYVRNPAPVASISRALLAERQSQAARISKIEALCTQHTEARSALSNDLLAAKSRIAALEALLKEADRTIEAATWARTRLHNFALEAQAGRVQAGGRELERKVWGAFSDFDAARTVAEKLKGAGA